VTAHREEDTGRGGAAGYFALAVILAAVATVALVFSHAGALIYLGAAASLIRGVRAARHR